MGRAEDKLEDYEQHKTPKQVAQYMRTIGRGVGRKYTTHGSVWNVSDQVLQIGLLHLLLDELELLNNKAKKEAVNDRKRQRWLRDWHPKVTSLLANIKQQEKRLSEMFGTNFPRPCYWSRLDIHDFSEYFHEDFDWFSKCLKMQESRLARLKSVKKPEDVINLHGIGKKTAEKLIKGIK